MNKATQDTVAALQAADDIRWRIEPTLCNTCEDVCYSLEGRASGDLGNSTWETPIAWVDHVSLSTALRVLLSTVGSQLARYEARLFAADQLERQTTIFDLG